MYLTFAILYVFYMCAAIGVIINDDDDDLKNVNSTEGFLSQHCPRRRTIISDIISYFF